MSLAAQEQRHKTQQYVKDHQIRELFSFLTQALVYHKPENPRQFIREEIRKMRTVGIQSLFTDQDIVTMFEMIDVTKQGSISVDQLRNTCRNLGTDGGGDSEIDEKIISAAGDTRGRVTLDGFKSVVSTQLAANAAWAKQ